MAKDGALRELHRICHILRGDAADIFFSRQINRHADNFALPVFGRHAFFD